MTERSLQELFAVLIARDLRPDDRLIMLGANMPMARAGALLANLTDLPNTRLSLGTSVDNLAGSRTAPPEVPFTFDPRALQHGEAWVRQRNAFDDMNFPDVFFLSGLEVDQRGNLNLFGIPDGNGTWRLRGPGALAQATFSTYCGGYYILMLRHEPRTFVRHAARISALGDRHRRRELGLPGGGPRLVLSPLGVFDFNDRGDMRVRSVHPGVTVEHVAACTGFELDVPEAVPATEPPREAERALLAQLLPVA